MTHAIPEPYCWDESFAVFYASIDDEHKGLFDGIFKCAGARGDAGALASLEQLVKTHFANEEAIMVKANYSDYDAHKKLHEEFLTKLGGLSCPLGDDGVNYAKNWLVQHIKTIDFKYKGKLN